MGPLQYTLGLCLNINGQWYCSAAIQFWDGRELEASGNPWWGIAADWYYDARWGILKGHQPASGEQVAVFAAQGNLRGCMDGSYGKERTDFVVIPWGSNY
jgi:hypothetical protein